MARYETYRANAAEVPIMRKWVLRALALSLLLHAGLVLFFHLKKLENFSMTDGSQLAPPIWVVKQAVIDPKLLEDEPEKLVIATPPQPVESIIEVPIEKPEPKEIQLSPQTTESSLLLTDKPKPAPFNTDLLTKIEADSSGRSDKELGSIAHALLDKGTRNRGQPVVIVPNPKRGGDGLGINEGIPGRQSLDDALTGTGSSAGKPVAMPGGALFEHDRDELMSAALDDLQKLAQLVARFPNATFTISGHTDWTGTAEYNLRLSERRAEAVKAWLVSNAGVSPERVQTIGRGNADAIVGPDRTVEEQQPNRRVEIVIKTNR